MCSSDLSGRVAHGERIGRQLGFPTANIVLRRRPPLEGIFVVTAELEETREVVRGVASVGRRPTVRADASPLLEVHLFDFSEQVYGRMVSVEFMSRLREERHYDSLDLLTAQIQRDAEAARAWHAAHPLQAQDLPRD